MNFEESLKKLKDLSEQIRSDNTTLDEAVKCYEEGLAYYKECHKMLNDTKQKIEIYKKEEERE